MRKGAWHGPGAEASGAETREFEPDVHAETDFRFLKSFHFLSERNPASSRLTAPGNRNRRAILLRVLSISQCWSSAFFPPQLILKSPAG